MNITLPATLELEEIVLSLKGEMALIRGVSRVLGARSPSRLYQFHELIPNHLVARLSGVLEDISVEVGKQIKDRVEREGLPD